MILKGPNVEIVSAKQEYDHFINETNEKRKKIKDVSLEIQRLKTNKPKLFGKEKWSSSLGELNKEREELEKRTDDKWVREENNKLYRKAYFFISTKQYSNIEKIVEKQPMVRGDSQEIFNNLKTKLREIIDKEIPETLSKLNEEFKDLKEKR